MGQLYQNTLHSRVTLEHSKRDSYLRTQKLGQLYWNTLHWTITLGHIRLDS